MPTNLPCLFPMVPHHWDTLQWYDRSLFESKLSNPPWHPLPSKWLRIRMARVTLEKRTSLAPGVQTPQEFVLQKVRIWQPKRVEKKARPNIFVRRKSEIETSFKGETFLKRFRWAALKTDLFRNPSLFSTFRGGGKTTCHGKLWPKNMDFPPNKKKSLARDPKYPRL